MAVMSVVTVSATPGSLSSIMETIRSAQSVMGRTEGCFRYNRSSVKAAFFLTNDVDVLREHEHGGRTQAETKAAMATHGLIIKR